MLELVVPDNNIGTEKDSITIILIGSTCAGKTTLEKKLIEVGVEPIHILTTREAREDDPDYIEAIDPDTGAYRSTDKDIIHSFFSNENTWYIYKEPDYTKINIVSAITLNNILPLLEALRSKPTEVWVYGLKASEEEIRECYEARGYNEDIINKRLSIQNKEVVKNLTYLDREVAFDFLMRLIDGYKKRKGYTT